MTDHLDLIAVNLIFDQLNATSAVVGENTKRLSFHEFLGALGSLALAMYDEIAPDQLAGFRVVHGDILFYSLRFARRLSTTAQRACFTEKHPARLVKKKKKTKKKTVRVAGGWRGLKRKSERGGFAASGECG